MFWPAKLLVLLCAYLSIKAIFYSHNTNLLKCAVQFSSPHLRKNIDRIEKVQRRATKSIPYLYNKPYDDRASQI